jgi:hypothetical protein
MDHDSICSNFRYMVDSEYTYITHLQPRFHLLMLNLLRGNIGVQFCSNKNQKNWEPEPGSRSPLSDTDMDGGCCEKLKCLAG